MEKVQVIEEKKMIRRLLGKLFWYTIGYGLLYIACMVIFFMFALFQDETFTNLISMCLLNIVINLVFVIMLVNSSVKSSFDGINTVNVPEKSRARIIKMVGTVLVTIMIVFTAINVITFHALFTSRIEITTETINSPKTIEEIKYENRSTIGTLKSVSKISDNNYLVTSKTYSQDALVILALIVSLNVLIAIGMIGYENELLQRYLVV